MNIAATIVSAGLLFLAGPSWAKPPHARGGVEHHEILEPIKEHHPEKYDHLIRLRDEDPKAFRHALRRVRHHLSGGSNMDDADPKIKAEKEKMRALKEEMREALEHYRGAAESDKGRARQAVEALAEDIFDAKQAHRQLRLERIREHLVELESEIQEREANRQVIIDEWISEKLESSPRGL